ncbi:MAG: NTP transferase domain-containing protein [Clostridia bacterium]|nr:NTP transferase domain-containing protein [Clostridia bacterium]
MNKQEFDLLITLKKSTFVNQRALAKDSGYSLGLVNSALKNLVEAGYLTADYTLSKKALALFEANTPKRAVILAAGSGIRMVPINTETPKALLQVKGEVLIERQIRQLNEAGVTDIAVVVGFLKEKFEYLIDKFGVDLVYNGEYYTKNNLHSLFLVKNRLAKCYIVPCDLWCSENPFSKDELYSWYAVTDEMTQKSDVFANRKGQLAKVAYNQQGNRMFGICYLDGKMGETVAKRLTDMEHDIKYSHSFWEEAVYEGKKMLPFAKVLSAESNFEINTYEQLRDIDSDSLQLKSEKIEIIAKAMDCSPDEIVDIKIQKKGMTNRSFLFTLRGKRYIMRVPGEGTDNLINRKEEAEVYKVIWDKKICDDVIYINAENGYKITAFLDNARVCDAENDDDLRRCMKRLRDFHNMKLKVSHTFDIFEKINFYESLWLSEQSQYIDYGQTKAKVFSLKGFVDRYKQEYSLTHIDAVPDNFLFCTDSEGKEDIRLIDWEYSAMQDPHVDIAMFIIYSMYDREGADNLIDTYFTEGCDTITRIKIYCYISMCGLLWSNWCEYKRDLGVEFGEYSLKQYRFAKEYYTLATELIKKEGLDAQG